MSHPICDNCSGNGGYYDRANGERYLSNPDDGTPWTRCPNCNGTGSPGDFVRLDPEVARMLKQSHPEFYDYVMGTTRHP